MTLQLCSCVCNISYTFAFATSNLPAGFNMERHLPFTLFAEFIVEDEGKYSPHLPLFASIRKKGSQETTVFHYTHINSSLLLWEFWPFVILSEILYPNWRFIALTICNWKGSKNKVHE